MRLPKAFLPFLALLVAVSAGAVPSPTPSSVPVHVSTRVDPRTVTIGTPFRYTLRVTADKDVELVVPVLSGRLGDFRITDFGEVPHPSGKGPTVVERWYEMVTYEPGDKVIPGPTVQYRVAGSDLRDVHAPDTLVIVKSLLSSDKKAADVRDIRPPATVPRDLRPLCWALGAILALVLGVFGLYRLLNRKRSVAGPPPRPPHEVALAALVRLRAKRMLEDGLHEEFYVELSAILRRYMEARFRLRAPEMTTEEFLHAAQRNPELSREHRAALGNFLAEADLVKFARHVPRMEDAEAAYEAARRFVETTRPVPEEESSRAAA